MYFTTTKIVFLVSTIIASIIEGIEEGNLINKYHSNHSKEAKLSYDYNYHWWQLFSIVGFMFVGSIIWLDSNAIWYVIFADLIVSGAIHWQLHDGIINLFRNKPWYFLSKYQKTHNTGIMGIIDSPLKKNSTLVIALLINYAVYII